MNNNNNKLNNKPKNNTMIILVIVFFVLVSLGAGAYYFFFRDKDKKAVDCELGNVGAYVDCTPADNCPSGMNQYAVRAVNTEAANGGQECPTITERRVYRAATDCSVGPWTAWQSCLSVHSCPAGFNQRRTRTKTPATSGGQDCSVDENNLLEYQCVATQSNDAEWTAWTSCNHDCPTGKTHKRTHNVCANEVMYKTESAVPCTPGTVWSNWTACTTPSDACPSGKNVYRTNANCPETKEYRSMTAHEQAFHNQLNALGYTASNEYYTVCPASKTPTEAECRAIGDYAISLSSDNNYYTIDSEYVPKCSWRYQITNRVIKYNTNNENRNFYNTEFNQICKN